MTTLTIDKELLEQAVDKLLTCWPKSDPLVNELRAALAAPATAPEKTVKEIMEFARHYAANTFSSATLEDKIRRALAAPATAPEKTTEEQGRSAMTKESDALAAFLSACIDGGMSGGEMKIAMAKFTRLAQPQGEPAIGCKCPLCGEWQRSTRSGMVCKNGHGGATGLNYRLFTNPAHTEQEVQEILDASYRESGALVVVVRRILGVPAQ